MNDKRLRISVLTKPVDVAVAGPKNLYGTTLQYVVSITGTLDENGMLVDFAMLKQVTRDLLDRLDHRVITRHELINRLEGVPSLAGKVSVVGGDYEVILPFEAVYPLPGTGLIPSDIARRLTQNLWDAVDQSRVSGIDVVSRSVSAAEYLHALPFYDGACVRLHGHSAKFQPRVMSVQVESQVRNLIDGKLICAEQDVRGNNNGFITVENASYRATLPENKLFFTNGPATLENIVLKLRETCGEEVMLSEGLANWCSG